MLDDLKYIHERDSTDALGVCEKQWQQLSSSYAPDQTKVDADNIVFTGMGGSALCALVCQSWPGCAKPFEVVRGYDIPSYVSSRTYFIASSYSGTTEETLSALAQAEKKGAKIAVIAGGGPLVEIAKTKHYPLALLPVIGQPRYALLAGLKALLTLLWSAGLLDADPMPELEAGGLFLQTAVQKWIPTVPAKHNAAKQLALECIGKSVVVYAGPKLYPAAYKWKIDFNENAKQVAWCNQFSEFNHNEFIGWSKQPIDKPYAIIMLKSDLENKRIQKRFELSERLLSGLWPHPYSVTVEGDNLLTQLLWAIAFGDFVSLYTALLNGLNPAPVELVEKLKKQLAV